MAHRPILSRRWLLLFGLIALGLAVKIALFEIARDLGDEGALILVPLVVIGSLACVALLVAGIVSAMTE